MPSKWVERSATHHYGEAGTDGLRCAPPILQISFHPHLRRQLNPSTFITARIVFSAGLPLAENER
jgi:hypothetical protein